MRYLRWWLRRWIPFWFLWMPAELVRTAWALRSGDAFERRVRELRADSRFKRRLRELGDL